MLAILTTHPIQYQVPLWQELASRATVPFEVWYLSDQGYQYSFDPGFQIPFSWDLDMLSGYPYRFILTRPLRANINTFCGAWVPSLASLFEQRRVTALLINGWYPGNAAWGDQRSTAQSLVEGDGSMPAPEVSVSEDIGFPGGWDRQSPLLPDAWRSGREDRVLSLLR